MDISKLQKIVSDKTLLIVDDSVLQVGAIRDVFVYYADYKIDIFVAYDGEKAIEIIKKEKMDLVITDWQMLKMDGLELIKEIRRTNFNLAIILMSGANPPDKTEELAYEFLKKPFQLEFLWLAIERAIQKVK